ncbi:MAG: GGDEF domain-containing protein [Halieaceae bacterium]
MGAEDDNTRLASHASSPEGVAYSDVDSQMGDFVRTVELNERILHRLQQYELMLLDAASLPALLDVLLYETGRHFTLSGISLSLYDPEGAIADLIPNELDYSMSLTLEADSFDMQQLYGARPEVELIASEDPRALRAIANVDTGQSAILLPLVRDGILVGSFHWVSEAADAFSSDVERDFMHHLASIIAICLENCLNAERLSRLSLLDPLTRLCNKRAFEMELRKEVSRAHRSNKSLTLMMMEVDAFKEIADNYGHLSGDFTLKEVATHVARMLRSTDLIARLDGARFALLLPACSESKGLEIAERMRSDTEFMEIDDGRGANLFASLSIGLTIWSPQNYPAINMEQLAGQIKATALQGLRKAVEGGGNRVAVARLTAMLV